MVERTKGEIVEEFDGECESVNVVPDQLREDEGGMQYELLLKPNNEEILKDSKTKRFHVWLRMTRKATDTSVPEGSRLDAYLSEIETVLPEAKKADKVIDALNMLVGKQAHFVRKKIGRAFKGHESQPEFVPQKLID